MKIFAVLLPMRDEEKSNVYRPQHLDYLAKLREEGKILANGRFTDGQGDSSFTGPTRMTRSKHTSRTIRTSFTGRGRITFTNGKW